MNLADYDHRCFSRLENNSNSTYLRKLNDIHIIYNPKELKLSSRKQYK